MCLHIKEVGDCGRRLEGITRVAIREKLIHFSGREMVNNTPPAPHPTFTFFPGFSEVGGRAFSVMQERNSGE